MEGRRAAAESLLHAALRFHDGQPMIYSTIAEKIFIQMNDSLEAPVFEQIDRGSVEDLLSRDDWEPWDEIRPN
jgi:hypothetical protein